MDAMVTEALGGVAPELFAAILFVAALVFTKGRCLKYVWRFAVGLPVMHKRGGFDSRWWMDAPPQTDRMVATTHVSVPRTWWGRMAGYKRMTLRWLGLAMAWVIYTAPIASAVVVGIIAAAAGSVKSVRAVVARFHREVVGRWTAAAAKELGWDDVPATEWVELPAVRVVWDPIEWPERFSSWAARWPRAWSLLNKLRRPVVHIPLEDDDARIVVHHPDTFAGDPVRQTRVKDLVTNRTAGEWAGEWAHEQLAVIFRHPTRLPSDVLYDVDEVARYGVTEVPIGKGRDRGWETIKLKDLTPHVVVAASTGWGKTVTLNVICAHVLSRGARVTILDPKRIGFVTAFRDHPQVSLRTNVDSQVGGIAEFLAEMERRYVLIEQYPHIKDDPELYFQPYFLVEDEKGSLTAAIRAWWKKQGEKGTPQPILDQKVILWQARAAGMHVITAAQQANLDVFIDSDGRDQYMYRIASGPQTRSSWTMLFPGTAKMRVAVKKGRAVIGEGPNHVKEVQLARITEREAAAIAMAGVDIARKENEQRAIRIAELIGESEEASHPAGGVGVPGETVVDVPGQRVPGGTGDDEADAAARAARPPLTLITEGGDDRAESSTSSDDLPADDGSNVRSNNGTGGTAEAQEDSDDVVGLEAGAALLGMSPEAFRKARQRRAIPGETRRGAAPSWTRSGLVEWHSQRPIAGAREVNA